MTPEQFCYWLDGFLTKNPYPDALTIREKLERVRLHAPDAPFRIVPSRLPEYPVPLPFEWTFSTGGDTKE